MFFEIPLTPEPQRFTISLNATMYNMEVMWNDLDATWFFNLYREDETLLLAAVPLVTGVDLLGQFRHLGIGGALVVQVLGHPFGMPAYDTLGTESKLLFETS